MTALQRIRTTGSHRGTSGRRTLTASVLLALLLATAVGCSRAPAIPDIPPMTPEQEELFFGPVALERITPSERAQELLARLEGGLPHEEFRNVMRGLVNLGEDAVPVLGARLEEILEASDGSISNAYRADNICDVLGQIESPSAEPYLIAALGHKVDFVRSKAIQSLGVVATDACVTAVIPFLRSDKTIFRDHAVRILLEVRSEAAQAAILEVIRDLPSIQMTDSMEILAAEGNRGVEPLARELVKSEGPLIRIAAAKALLDLGDAGAMAVLEEGLRHERPDVRLRVVEVLALRGDERAVGVLEQIYDEDPGFEARRIAVIGMRRSDAASWETLERILREDESAMIRVEAARGLFALDPGRALALLVADLDSEDTERRKDAIRTLRFVRDPGSIEPILERFDRFDVEESKYALTTLTKRRAEAAIPRILRVIAEDTRPVDERRTLADVAADYAPIFLDSILDPLVAAYRRTKDRDAKLRFIHVVERTLHRDSLRSAGKMFQSEPEPGLRLRLRQAAMRLRESEDFFREAPIDPPMEES